MKLIEFIHALLYIGTEQVRSWIHHPLWQASQCGSLHRLLEVDSVWS